MLTELRIRDYALMDELSVRFVKGLNILTGETGAGKSIIIGALGLALGERADQDSIRTGADEAVAEAVFDLSENKDITETIRSAGVDLVDGCITLRRALSRSGRTRCHLNDSPVTLSALRGVGDELLDMLGQHEHQSLFRAEKHLDYLDRFGRLEVLVAEVGELFATYEKLKAELKERRKRLAELKEREELYRFQLAEIKDANLAEGEDEELERERAVMENVEELLSSTQAAYKAIHEDESSVLDSLGRLENILEKASELDGSLKATLETVKAISYQLDDLWRSLLAYQKRLEFDPERLAQIRERIDLIRSLKKKYGTTLRDVMDNGDKIEKELQQLTTGEESFGELEAEMESIRSKLSQKAWEVSRRRRKAASKLEKRVISELEDLGMKNAKFRISFELEEEQDGLVELEGKRYRTTERGIDRAEFLISPNPGEDLKPLRRIASGGEISRMMLAMKSILAEADPVPILIFDEIDVGIGGRVAEAVGRKLRSLSSKRQILCITHLPQIAVNGEVHLEVRKVTRKGRTYTQAAGLEKEGRVKEIARMLGGEKSPETAIRHAQQMLKKANEEVQDG